MGRETSVGIATRYGLDGPGIESRWGRDFSHPFRLFQQFQYKNLTVESFKNCRNTIPARELPLQGQLLLQLLYRKLWHFIGC